MTTQRYGGWTAADYLRAMLEGHGITGVDMERLRDRVQADRDNRQAHRNGALIEDLSKLNTMHQIPDCWGLSFSGHIWEDAAEPFEISLVHVPAHDGARVLAAGPRAISTYQLLTEQPAPRAE
jgi:hypothetical protein